MGMPVRTPMGLPVRISMGMPMGIHMGIRMGIPMGIPRQVVPIPRPPLPLSAHASGLLVAGVGANRW